MGRLDLGPPPEGPVQPLHCLAHRLVAGRVRVIPEPSARTPHLGDPCIKVVSDRLNHSSTFVTREIYTHVTPPMQSDAAERVAARIFGASNE